MFYMFFAIISCVHKSADEISQGSKFDGQQCNSNFQRVIWLALASLYIKLRELHVRHVAVKMHVKKSIAPVKLVLVHILYAG